MFIIMLGGPGVGKGSYGKKIAEDYGVAHISTGDIIRNEIKNNTELGENLKIYVEKGKLVPHKTIVQIVKNRLLQDDCKNGVLLDGFPRTKRQAVALEKILKEKGEKVDFAIEIIISDEDIITRIINRQICSNENCKATYNSKFSPPKVDGICDICGKHLEKRSDDNEKVVKNRLKTYHKTSKKLLEYYSNKRNLYKIFPDIYSKDSFEQTIKEIKNILNKKEVN